MPPKRRHGTIDGAFVVDDPPEKPKTRKPKGDDEKGSKFWLFMILLCLAFALWVQFGEDPIHESFVEEIEALSDDNDIEADEDDAIISDQLLDFLDPIIDGSGIAGPIPEVAQGYLLRHNNDPLLASRALLATYKSPWMKLKTFVIGSIPILGLPASMISTIWRQLRLVGLIAAINGNDVTDAEVQSQMLMCLVEPDMAKVPKKIFSTVSKDLICKFVAKKLTGKFASKGVKFAVKMLPIGGVLDVLMDDTPTIGVNAQAAFGTEPLDLPPAHHWAAYALYCIIAIAVGKYLEKRKIYWMGTVGLFCVLAAQLAFDTWEIWGEEA